MMRLIRNSKAFTLVEILIVVAILGLLAAIAIPNLIKAREGSAETACKMNRAVIKDAIRIWATKENKSIDALQAKFNGKTVKDVSGDGVEIYFDPDDAVCPSDDTQAYTSTVDANGLITIYCPTHAAAPAE